MTRKRRPGERVDRDAVVAAILAGLPNDQAAEAAGCSVRTIQRYRLRDDVRADLRAARLARMREHTDRLASILGDGIDKLAEIIRDPAADPRVVVSAVRAVASMHADHEDRHDFAERLDHIERSLRARGFVGPVVESPPAPVPIGARS